MNFDIRKCSDKDIVSVMNFLVEFSDNHNRINPRNKGDEQINWEWLYLRESNQSRTAVAAYNDNDEVIAHYGISPLKYVTPDGGIEIGIICKLAIAEVYRRSVLFLQISLQLFKLAKEDNITHYAGLANRSGLTEFHQAMGFVNKGEIPVLFAPVSISSLGDDLLPRMLFLVLRPALMLLNILFRIYLRFFFIKMVNSIEVVEISTVDIKQELNNILSSSHLYYADRSPEILSWRFFQNSSRKYVMFGAYESGLKGYVVLRRMKMRKFNGVAIVDIVVDSDNPLILKSLIKTAYEFALEQEASCLASLLSDEHICELMLKLGFFKTKESFNLVARYPNNNNSMNYSKLNDWYVTWFDHDTA